MLSSQHALADEAVQGAAVSTDEIGRQVKRLKAAVSLSDVHDFPNITDTTIGDRAVSLNKMTMNHLVNAAAPGVNAGDLAASIVLAINVACDRNGPITNSITNAINVACAPNGPITNAITNAIATACQPGGAVSNAITVACQPGGAVSNAITVACQPGGAVSNAIIVACQPGGAVSNAITVACLPGGAVSGAIANACLHGGVISEAIDRSSRVRDVGAAARVLNGSRTNPADAVEQIPSALMQMPPLFPLNRQSFSALSANNCETLLQFYGLDRTGNVSVKRQRLAAFFNII
ncbi:hypothetical protein BJ742DRAFT_833032 [Cladochytrium replicatum]|nr:hypothetical protein BJ742DRAFT_833032 [Cladochytrium replicatum]